MPKKSEIIFISDLHLALEKTVITQRFLDFLHYRAQSASALYILGDLFDVWIGDDDDTPPNKAIKAALKQLVDSGTAVYLILGNRDFLLGAKFCQQTGITLLEDYAVIKLANQSVLLTHGDLLCTDDLAYQAFRIKSRDSIWRQNVLSKPLLIRLLVARWYRFRSYFHKKGKTQAIMDVNQATVESVLKQFQCLTLVHGHTHRPACHQFQLGQQLAERWVLAEWKKDSTEILCWQNGHWQVEKLR